MITERHCCDNRNCKERGNRAELLLRLAFEAIGKTYETPTPDADKWDHIDLYTRDSKGTRFGIQIKGYPSSYEDYLCVEIKGTKYEGSLYRTKAYCLAYEREDRFILVRIEELRKWVHNNVKNQFTRSKIEATENNFVYLRPSEYGTNHLVFIPVEALPSMTGTGGIKKARDNIFGLQD